MLRLGMKLKTYMEMGGTPLSLLMRKCVIKMSVLPGIFLFQTILVLTPDVPFKQWQKNISKFAWQEKRKAR